MPSRDAISFLLTYFMHQKTPPKSGVFFYHVILMVSSYGKNGQTIGITMTDTMRQTTTNPDPHFT